ncbi:MAG: hypothetical protein WBP11_06395 [Dokdonella sp.]
MKIHKHVFALIVVCLGGQSVADSQSYPYFPQLAQRVLAGDAQAFREVLATVAVTSPGEQLEELAELSSRYLRLAPKAFLEGQRDSSSCFGVGFMGVAYVDDADAVVRELTSRRLVLESVTDPTLDAVKRRCLTQLDRGR